MARGCPFSRTPIPRFLDSATWQWRTPASLVSDCSFLEPAARRHSMGTLHRRRGTLAVQSVRTSHAFEEQVPNQPTFADRSFFLRRVHTSRRSGSWARRRTGT
eukprot:scaffold471_cov372-Pavlova_lutheri.AAC.6